MLLLQFVGALQNTFVRRIVGKFTIQEIAATDLRVVLRVKHCGIFLQWARYRKRWVEASIQTRQTHEQRAREWNSFREISIHTKGVHPQHLRDFIDQLYSCVLMYKRGANWCRVSRTSNKHVAQHIFIPTSETTLHITYITRTYSLTISLHYL